MATNITIMKHNKQNNMTIEGEENVSCQQAKIMEKNKTAQICTYTRTDKGKEYKIKCRMKKN